MIAAKRIVLIFGDILADSSTCLSCNVGTVLFGLCIFPTIKGEKELT